MFACYMGLAELMPDGTFLMSQIGRATCTYEDFCYMLDSIVKHYNLTIDHSEVDTKRNDVIIYTNNTALSIFVEPNYSFAWMDNVSLEEMKRTIDGIICMRIAHKCAKCGQIEIVHCKDLKEMACHSDYNDLPDGWLRVYGKKLCPSCAKEYRKFLDRFLKNDSENS